jgi:hypothetical protein
MHTYTINDALNDPQLDVAVWNRIYNRYNYSTGEWSSSPNSQSYGELQLVHTLDELLRTISASVAARPLVVVVPHLASGSDYSGCLVHRANHDALVADGAMSFHGGYNTFSAVIPVSKIDDHADSLAALADYPLLDEEAHSRLEAEAIENAWEYWARDDFRAAIGDDDHEIDDDTLRSRFEAAREAANEYWENEQGESMWINLDRIAEHVGA